MHGAWGRSFGAEALALAPVGSAAGLLQYAAAHPFQALNGLGLVFALGLIWPVWAHPGRGVDRVHDRQPAGAAAWVAGFGVLHGLAAALFFTWRELF